MVAIGAVLLCLVLTASLGRAQEATYDLSWWSVDGGGATFGTGGGYTLGSTAGQPDAGVLANSGYTLNGGFWRSGVVQAASYRVYLPIVLRATAGAAR